VVERHRWPAAAVVVTASSNAIVVSKIRLIEMILRVVVSLRSFVKGRCGFFLGFRQQVLVVG
jgi:hypothetical protein